MSEAIDWRALADTVIGYRNRKGFEPSTWDTAPVRMNCINCEIYELEEALGARAAATPAAWWPVRYECADIVMYSLTLLRDLGATDWEFRRSFHGGARAHASPAELTMPMRKYSRQAFEFWRKANPKELLISLEILVVSVVDLRTRVLVVPGTIETDVHAKIASSANRPAASTRRCRSISSRNPQR